MDDTVFDNVVDVVSGHDCARSSDVIFRLSDSAVIDCMLSDVSESQIEIVSTMNLSTRDIFYVLTDDGKVSFKVVSKTSDPDNTAWWRYILDSLTPSLDLTSVLVEIDKNRVTPSLGEQTAKPKKQVDEEQDLIAPRFLLESDMELVVTLKTIGTRSPYELKVENISKSGLLVSTIDRGVPFIVNTIVEIEIDPRHKILKTSLSCMGKVTKSSAENIDAGVSKKFLGIKLVNMNEKDISSWGELLVELEKKLKN